MTDLTIPKNDLMPKLETPESKLTVRLGEGAAPVRVKARLPFGEGFAVIDWRSAGATFDRDELADQLATWATSELPREELADHVLRGLRDAGLRASSTNYDTGRQIQLLVDHVTLTYDQGDFAVEAGLPR